MSVSKQENNSINSKIAFTPTAWYSHGMKKLSKKAVIISTVLAVTIVPSVAFAAINLTQKPVQKQPEVVVQKLDVAVAEPETTTTPEVVPQEITPEPMPAVEATETAPTPVPTSTVLSAQELAEKYNLVSNPLHQKCFDRIIAYYPERFTEDVREANIKSIRYLDICMPISNGACIISTDIHVELHMEACFGPKGEYFDSLLAEQRRSIP